MARPSDRRSSSSPRKRSGGRFGGPGSRSRPSVAPRADARGPAGRDRGPARRKRATSQTSIENLIARQPWSDLVPHIARAGVPAEPALTRLRTFARLVIGWNRGVSNLISKNDESRIVTRHLLESIEPAVWLAETAAERWIDFGSGAGFPAIPLAIVGIGRSWTLVESRRPKTLFMRKALEEIKLHDIDVYHGRLEALIAKNSISDVAAASSENSPRFDAFTSRATLKLAPTLELAAAVIRKGGAAFLWKGSRRDDELVDTSTWNRLWELDRVVELGEANTAVAKFIRI